MTSSPKPSLITRRTKSDSELPSPSTKTDIKFSDESYQTPKSSRTMIRDMKLVKRKFQKYTVSKRRRCQIKPRVLFPVDQADIKDEIEDLACKVLNKKVSYFDDDHWFIEKLPTQQQQEYQQQDDNDNEQEEEEEEELLQTQQDINNQHNTYKLESKYTFDNDKDDLNGIDDMESPEVSSITETCSEP